MRFARVLQFLLVVCSVGFFSAEGSVSADHNVARYVVNTTADEIDGTCDSTHCSLREAVIAANHGTEFATIEIPAGTYVLNRTGPAWIPDEEVNDLDIHNAMRIVGSGVDSTILSGGHLNRVLDIQFYENSSYTQISNLTIQNGYTIGHGAGIRATNMSSAETDGSDLVLENCRITSNVANSNIGVSALGAGIYSNNATLEFFRCELDNNSNYSGRGGGIAIENGGKAFITQSVIHHNDASRGAGIAIWGNQNRSSDLYIYQSAIYQNAGEGVRASDYVYTKLFHSTISGNEDVGFYTFSNTLPTITHIDFSTITANQGGVEEVNLSDEFSTIVLTNSIIAENYDLNGTPDDCRVDDTMTDLIVVGVNLIQSMENCDVSRGSVPDIISGVDPLLGPLSDNGGFAPTHALLTGSPALDAFVCEFVDDPLDPDLTAPRWDQRELARPSGTACDLGAYEYSSEVPVISDDSIQAPSDLLVERSGSNFHFTWTDNSNNEDLFEITVEDDMGQSSLVGRAEQNQEQYDAVIDFPSTICTLSFEITAQNTLESAYFMHWVMSEPNTTLVLTNPDPACQPDMPQTSPFEVTTVLDEYDGLCGVNHCSLREAITAVNQTELPDDADDQVIYMPISYSVDPENWDEFRNPILLTRNGRDEDNNTTGDLDIYNDVTIYGYGLYYEEIGDIDNARLDANGADRIFDVHTGWLDLRGIRLTNGAAERGGAVLVRDPRGNLRTKDVIFENNTADEGAAVHLNGFSSFEDTAFYQNDTDITGAVHVKYGFLELFRSSIIGNQGAGLWINDGEVRISETTISENTGYGIFNVVSDSQICCGGTLMEIRGVTIADNRAGGIFVQETPEKHIQITNSIISGNGPNSMQDCGNINTPNVPLQIYTYLSIYQDALHCQPLPTNGLPALWLHGIDPRLEPVNGPGTDNDPFTRALRSDSPALNYVTNSAYCWSDQRRIQRTTPCDAGAFESNLIYVPPTEEPTPEVTVEPTEEPTPEVTIEPTEEPTPEPTEEPTEEPTPIGSQNLILNGDFGEGLTNWQTGGAIVSRFTEGAFEFYFNPTLGTQKPTLTQTLNEPVTSDQTLELQLNLANSATVRKLVRVALSAPGQADSMVCTFWLDAAAPWRTYTLRGRPQISWNQTQVQLTLQTADNRRWVAVDNVQLYRDDAVVDGAREAITCTDPTAPLPGTGADSANLIRNGGFSQNLTRWTFTGDGVSRFRNGMFEFYYPNTGRQQPTLQQVTTTSVPDNAPFEVRLWLGNRSSVRKPVLVTLRARNNSDSQQCLFWLPPNTPLGEYVMRTFSTTAFTDLTLAVQTSQRDGQGWIRLDNVTVQHRPTMAVNGTSCTPAGANIGALGSAPAEVIEPVGTEVPAVTLEPTMVSTDAVTETPTAVPTEITPTVEPTLEPTIAPTDVPTIEPTIESTTIPTEPPTPDPTASPEPTSVPEPTEVPTEAPTEAPAEATTEG